MRWRGGGGAVRRAAGAGRQLQAHRAVARLRRRLPPPAAPAAPPLTPPPLLPVPLPTAAARPPPRSVPGAGRRRKLKGYAAPLRPKRRLAGARAFGGGAAQQYGGSDCGPPGDVAGPGLCRGPTRVADASGARPGRFPVSLFRCPPRRILGFAAGTGCCRAAGAARGTRPAGPVFGNPNLCRRVRERERGSKTERMK